jgi:hypothetical protein
VKEITEIFAEQNISLLFLKCQIIEAGAEHLVGQVGTQLSGVTHLFFFYPSPSFFDCLLTGDVGFCAKTIQVLHAKTTSESRAASRKYPPLFSSLNHLPDEQS